MAYDYVIVGAGSAGCLLANRLSADPEVTVLLLEAGGEDSYRWIQVPVGFPFLLGNPAVDWCFQSEPEPYLDNRVTPVPRGKVLGGSSSINALCYIRGTARDYDGWRDAGCPGWGWADVLPYFRKFEDYPHGESAAHGAGGEIGISETPARWPVLEAWKQAAIAHGIPETPDHNAGDNEGVKYFQGFIRNGRRSSASQAFLHPVRYRSNLTVATKSHVTRIRFQGKIAVGVDFIRKGEKQTADAKREVILSAGSIGSPQILQLSGVGPGDLLREKNIPVINALPGVGENMQDHWQIRLVYRVRHTVTMNEWVTNPLRRYAMGAWYVLTRRGPMSAQPPQLCAFTRSDGGQPAPNLQYHVSAASAERFGGPLHPWPALSMGIAVVRPQAVGHCHIKSADPFAPPAILHNFLREPAAQKVAVDAIRQARRIMKDAYLERFEPQEYTPGEKAQTDEQILAYARQTVFTVFHQCGTCKMGGDPMAVTDERLRVRGLERLRVVDASIMPAVTHGNTNAPTYMIAEKAAAMIREDRRAA